MPNTPEIISRNVGEWPYRILIGHGLKSTLIDEIRATTQARKICVLADSAIELTGYHDLIEELRGAGFEPFPYIASGTKKNKTIETALDVIRTLIDKEFTRDATLLTFGGGVTGDLGGLVAALYYRGMNLIHIPSTLTSQIDSSIGGKVAINFHDTVNSIGTYYHPRLIVVDLDLLTTLSDRDFRAGMAEVIKSALIADPALVSLLQKESAAILSRDFDLLANVIERTINIKLDHVSGDVREDGKRLFLNYGHTVGQAIEIATGLSAEVYRHGEAVSLGMIAAARLADSYYKDGKNRAEIHQNILQQYVLPVHIDSSITGMDPQDLHITIHKSLFRDKKRQASGLRFVFLTEIGKPEVLTLMEDWQIKDTVFSLID